MWFGHAQIQLQDGLLTIGTSSQFEADWVSRRFSDELNAFARNEGGHGIHIEVLEASDQIGEPLQASNAEDVPSKSGPGLAKPRRQLLDLNDLIIGPSNQLACSAARSIAEDPQAQHLSPLFIHGGCGVGKTHLLQGACRHFIRIHGGASVRYMTGEEFTNQYIQAVRHNQLDRFRRTMRRLHLLAIDDVHFVAGKTRTQEEILHTLDAIGLSGARILLASDCHPALIRRFNRGLASRCSSGMLVHIEPADRNMRARIAIQLATRRHMALDSTAADQVAAECPDGTRSIQGLLTRLEAVRSVTARNTPVTVADVREAAHLEQPEPRAHLQLEHLIFACCEALHITSTELLGPGRAARVVLARAMIASLARTCTTASFPDIARALGRRAHSSVHAAAQRLDRRIEGRETVTLDAQQISLSVLRDQIQRSAMTHAANRLQSRREDR